MDKKKKYVLRLIGIGTASIFSIIGLSFAWFNHQTYGEVNNINIEVIESNELAISFVDTEYSRTLIDDYNGVAFKQISGDGVNFYTPIAGGISTGEIKQYQVNGYSKLDSENYLDYFYYRHVNFKTDKDINLYLAPICYVRPGDTTKRLNTSNVSKDYIAGAIRVGISRLVNEEYIPLAIWAPNSTYEASDSVESMTFKENGTVEETYYVVSGEDYSSRVPIETNSVEKGCTTIKVNGKSINYIWGDIDESRPVTLLPSGVNDLVISIWLEGTDRECVESLSGGEFNILLSFTSAIYHLEEE